MFCKLWRFPGQPQARRPAAAHSLENIGFIGFIGTVSGFGSKTLKKIGTVHHLGTLEIPKTAKH